MTMLDSVKQALRVSNNAYDDEILDLIDAGKSDLRLAGIFFEEGAEETDPLIKRAVKVYAKANFGYDNTEADRFQDSFVMLKQHLALSGDYRAVE